MYGDLNLSRSASYLNRIEAGWASRFQPDLLGFVQIVPDRARQRILDLAATQLKTVGLTTNINPSPSGATMLWGNFNDDPAWLVLSTAAYLKETADWGILDELVPYENKPGTETPLLEHLERCIQYTLDNIGPHGLPLIGRADWNDCLNLNTFSDKPGESFQTTTNQDGKNAESIVVAALFIMATRELAQIKGHLGQESQAAHLQQIAEDMTITTQKFGWDGDWFLRAYDHFGDKIGSKTCDEGKIFIESQGLCTMAGIGVEDGMAGKALQAVEQHLATEHGIVLLDPPYRSYHLHLGEISSYPPGYKENGSVFCHTNPWMMIAETLLGHGDQALDYYLRINPSNRESISAIHRCEPYVYAQTIAGKAADHFGEAKNSWLTGTAAWNYVAITQWILGIRPDYDGLRIDPCVPASWDGFKVIRRYRGATYHISVTNPDGVAKGIRSMTVDGMRVAGATLPIFSEGGDHQVEVVMG